MAMNLHFPHTSKSSLVATTMDTQVSNSKSKDTLADKLEIVVDKSAVVDNNKINSDSHIVMSSSNNRKHEPSNVRLCKKVGYALAYAISSFLLMSVNKIVLTSWKFPSPTVLVVGQIVATIVILFVAKKMRAIHFPDFVEGTFMKLHPLPVLYLGNAVTGLGGTKELSLPMFTAVRRFGILMTMVAEFYILGIKTPLGVQFSVYVMVVGSLIAAVSDIKFTVMGYTMVMMNNLFTAMKGVVVKQKLNTTEFGAYGIVFYNALFTLFPAIVISYLLGDFQKAASFRHWNSVEFLIYFFLTCILGLVLIWSAVECTNHNSALTTGIVGTIKNILITYTGMFIGGDYVLEIYNFLGLTLSVFGSLVYIYVAYKSGNTTINQ